MKFVAILLSLLLAVAPKTAWAVGSSFSAGAAAARGGARGLPTAKEHHTTAPGWSPARTAGERRPAYRPTQPTAGPGRVSAARVEHEFGIPARNQAAFQRFADRRNLVIDVRPTNPASVEWLKRGALPKPEAIKAKTVNAYDLMLNPSLPKDSRGLVALFKPVMPMRGSNVSDHEWANLGARYKQRLDEWQKLAPVIGKGGQAGRYRVTSSGHVEGIDGKGAWKPITGDHDLFEIRRPDGSRLPRHEEDAVIREMKDRNMGVQHGPHVSWSPPAGSWERAKIFETIIQGHKPGGEPLVRFAPGQKPRLAWASTPVAE